MKKYLFSLIALGILAGASCQQMTNSEKEMKALVEKNVKVHNGGTLSMFDEILSSEYVLHENGATDITGIDAIKENITSTRTSFPDFNISIDEIIINGDKVVTRWTSTGTSAGPTGDSLPTGKKFKVSGVTIDHVVDGKIREEWIFFNQALMLTQLGFTITPPEE